MGSALRRRRAVIMATLLSGWSCGHGAPPSSTVVGDWTGRVAPLHFAYLSMRFDQTGGGLSGTACYDSEGFLAFSGARVAVDYPNVTVTVRPENTQPCCRLFAGWTFAGKFTNDGRLDGVSISNGTSYPMSLTPGGTLCSSSKPAP